MSDWTPELKAEVIEEYTSSNPTAETTIEIVEKLAEKHDKTVNGLRMILSKGNVYVSAGKKTTTTAADSNKPKRKSKQDSLDELNTLLTSNGVELDDTVTSKLTGKAAEFFIGAFKTILDTEDESE